jgi:hypothetical protein
VPIFKDQVDESGLATGMSPSVLAIQHFPTNLIGMPLHERIDFQLQRKAGLIDKLGKVWSCPNLPDTLTLSNRVIGFNDIGVNAAPDRCGGAAGCTKTRSKQRLPGVPRLWFAKNAC